MAYLIVDDEVDSQRDDSINITSRRPTNLWTAGSVHALVTFQLLGLRFPLYLCFFCLVLERFESHIALYYQGG